ncbi:MAG: hypothetical protein ACI3Y3_05675, partial [Candidatus Cryptobacteroides sp.]
NRCKDFPIYAFFRAMILDFRPRLANRCRVEWFRLQLSLLQRGMARLQHRCEAQARTGCHEGGIILSKKPPEWHLSLPQQRYASDSNLPCCEGEWFRLQWSLLQGRFA